MNGRSNSYYYPYGLKMVKLGLIDQIKLPFVEEIYTINTVEGLAKIN